ncbi:hypothetical protein IGS59_25185 [Janthinobacterium sp. GW460P]|uniref:hypothetical protein n=1 Tax=unclassified Janthinobacterium TaxID=2610881 RepID=UPI00111C2540|nr:MULTISPECIES: hypothetical protein [unclassified Janthinobacterium]MCC7705541.1 hypothetical protein [Janthinobacterium sp. GW460P]MCC7711011.1 hypothetical protein [Janthinobacterium sp. GW460W]
MLTRPSTAACAPAPVITVDPGSLRKLFPWLLQADPGPCHQKRQASLSPPTAMKQKKGSWKPGALWCRMRGVIQAGVSGVAAPAGNGIRAKEFVPRPSTR